MYHYKKSQKLLCQEDLDSFWDGKCLEFDDNLQVCDQQGIHLFLGRCAEQNGYQICPLQSQPIYHVEITKERERDSDGCIEGPPGGKKLCPSDLLKAFDKDECFLVDHQFICEEDLEYITETMCLQINNEQLCDFDLYNLFAGKRVSLDKGRGSVQAKFADDQSYSNLCRHTDNE